MTPYLDQVARKTANEVFHAKSWGVSLGHEIINELKAVALASERHRARLCLHPSPEDFHQEMLIVLAKSAIERPQRRTIGFDTKIVMEGRAAFRFFSEGGDELSVIKMGDRGALYVHTCSPDYHSIVVESDWFVFLEILDGPFNSSTTEFAPWGQREEGAVAND